jgi:hypothetical protein
MQIKYLSVRRLHNLYFSQNIIRMMKSMTMRWAGHVGKRKAHRILVGKLGGTTPLGQPRCTWVDNTKIYLRDIECGVIGCSNMAQHRDEWKALVNMVVNLPFP